MTEENTQATETEAPPVAPEPDPDANVREHKAFKAVTTQLNESRKQNEKLAAQMEKFQKAEEQRLLDTQKKEGDFEAAEKTYMERIAALEASITDHKAQGQRQQTVADLKIQLTAKGVMDLEHVDMLSDRYLKLEEPPDVNEWVESIAAKDTYSVFFNRGKAGLKAPPNQSAAVSVANKTMAELREDLKDPTKAKEASAYVTSYFQQHGKMPD